MIFLFKKSYLLSYDPFFTNCHFYGASYIHTRLWTLVFLWVDFSYISNGTGGTDDYCIDSEISNS